MSRKTLYLANPYGFSRQQAAGPLADLVRALTLAGAEVWEPFARNNRAGKSAGWAYHTGQADVDDVRAADGLFAVVNGCPPDEGVMVELGLAIAWKKPTFLFRDDFRRCTDSEAYPLNLMLFTGLPATDWERYWYASLDELTDPDKALSGWLRNNRPSRIPSTSRESSSPQGDDPCSRP
ncbi:MAG: nucleoside 2-deoxyribosyltransferase [Acidobacteria bacterium]|nr:nucleoside 2-deoxyribosyltransferase [Acidobacteriota bacterium]